jgi:hypothetical protein
MPIPADTPPPTGEGTATAPKGASMKEVETLIRSILGKDATSRDATLTAENFKLRQQRRELRDQLAAATKSQPGKDALVLMGDDKKAYEEFKALNLKPGDIKTGLEERDTLRKGEAERAVGATIDEAAELLGWTPAALRKAIAKEGLHVEIKEVKSKNDEGKTVTERVPHVRKAANEKDALQALAEFAEGDDDFQLYLPALTSEGETSTGSQSSTKTTAAKAVAGVRMPSTGSSKQTAPTGGASKEKALTEAVERQRATIRL